MREKLLSMSVLRLRRYPLTFLGIVLALLVSAMPVGADVISIDPSDVPEVTLPPDEAQRLETLQKAEFPGIVSGTSPNGKFVLTRTAAADMTFLNVITGQTVR